MKLVDDWRDALKFNSVRISAIAAALAGVASEVWNGLDSATQEAILGKVGLGGILKVVSSVFIAVLIARLKAQSLTPPSCDKPTPAPADENEKP